MQGDQGPLRAIHADLCGPPPPGPPPKWQDAPPAGAAPRTPFARIAQWLDTAQCFTFEEPQKQAVFRTFNFGRMKAELMALQARQA